MDAELAPKPQGYEQFLAELKDRIRRAQVRAAQAVTSSLVLLYWRIGRDILGRQEQAGWGAKVIDQLATDLRRSFPDVQGFSARNLKYMRAFAEAFPEEGIVQQLLHKCPWGHLLHIMQKLKTPAEREWYVRATLEHGWSRAVLAAQIDTRLIDRQGAAPTNFERTLPAPQSDLARETIKDPYTFDFLTLRENAQERDLERGLIEHLGDFLVELGKGFAFLGNQVPITVAGDEFRIDLLFYHVHLHCYVVIELKMGEFRPEYAGKLNFYLSAVDDRLRDPENDHPTIGILLCRSKNNIIVEYALRDITKPMGVSQVELSTSLPPELEGQLPTIEDLEEELGGDDD